MKRQFTKKTGLLLLLIGLGVLFTPYLMAVTRLGGILFPETGDANAGPVILTMIACWAIGPYLMLWGLWCIVCLPFKAKPDRCEKCGYPYTGLTEPRCPECGTKFDPGKISTDAEQRKTPPTSPPTPDRIEHDRENSRM